MRENREDFKTLFLGILLGMLIGTLFIGIIAIIKRDTKKNNYRVREIPPNPGTVTNLELFGPYQAGDTVSKPGSAVYKRYVIISLIK